MMPVLCVAAMIPGSPEAPKIEELSWMTGRWEAEKWGGTWEETWLAPRAGTMVGTSRLVVEGKSKFMEFMAMETDGEGKITLFVKPGLMSKSTGPAVPFPLIAYGKNTATFESERNEFPSKLVYTRSGKQMNAVLTGVEDGKDMLEVFEFKLAK